jgi:hypothetical protein
MRVAAGGETCFPPGRRGGLKDTLILERFQSAGDIQDHLETLTWE